MSGRDENQYVSALPVLDQEMFQELQEAVAQRVGSLASIYNTFTANAALLIASLASESGPGREKMLHTLKGSAAMMGAARIAKLAAELQEAGAHLAARGMQDGIEQLDNELAAFCRELDARLKSVDEQARRA